MCFHIVLRTITYTVHTICSLSTYAFRCMPISVIHVMLTICSSVCNVLPYNTNSRCVYVCLYRLTASRHSYANCIMGITYSLAYTSIQGWSSCWSIGLVWPRLHVRSRNNPTSCTYICVSTKPATRQERSHPNKI
jgi:hypothetical protein